ncbi:hypothetical protein Y032_0119g857 [Ancylostoma ceylanicum]|uniref:U4/U6.U5 small nuclear ribonucleoprotein 27 kDa protein n=1 Tax=Ancylostoma ceylanicum TaxID=53326 RepID=A0A016TBD4_9BILA|nr:hypothetical protein Y032_0119g857 [Ancylostoma ceylanicum]
MFILECPSINSVTSVSIVTYHTSLYADELSIVSPYERRRSRSRERRGRDRDDRRSRDSRSPHDRRRRDDRKTQEPISLDQIVNCEQDVSALMGFAGFDTTKNKKVAGNYEGAVKINKPRRYRQYMNRKGGFNRPLDYIA